MVDVARWFTTIGVRLLDVALAACYVGLFLFLMVRLGLWYVRGAAEIGRRFRVRLTREAFLEQIESDPVSVMPHVAMPARRLELAADARALAVERGGVLAVSSTFFAGSLLVLLAAAAYPDVPDRSVVVLLLLWMLVFPFAAAVVLSDWLRRGRPVADLAVALHMLVQAAPPAGARSAYVKASELRFLRLRAVRRAIFAAYRVVNVPAKPMVGVSRRDQRDFALQVAAAIAAEQRAVAEGHVSGAVETIRIILFTVVADDWAKLPTRPADADLARELRLGGVDRYSPLAYGIFGSSVVGLILAATAESPFWAAVAAAAGLLALQPVATALWRQWRA